MSGERERLRVNWGAAEVKGKARPETGTEGQLDVQKDRDAKEQTKQR